ncbi:uncharacterized protein LOC119735517 isoform X2 [Patiria miniata]|uniref:HECT domain-containing protein n=1 Tax=Patiria miniata TaxID=46514 RepID=A0A914ANI8_PATMI|nr:uncharacterized protein LOC119735517 isoform X2 [Patiria miniata]
MTEPETSKLHDFLKKRDVDDQCIQRMEEDKIDLEVICLMSDDALRDYLPRYGDRIAVVSFAKSKDKQSQGNTDRKTSLVESLKNKMTSHLLRSKSQIGNENAKKQERRVEVGWVHYDFDMKEYKQIYQKKGGGIKHQKYKVDTRLSEIMEQAITWFFPGGKNRHGNVSDFDVFITDPSFDKLDGDTTVQQMYETARVKILRLYIATKKKVTPDKNVESCSKFPEGESSTSSDEFVHAPVTNKRPKRRCKQGTAKGPKTPSGKKTKVKSHKQDESRISGTPPLDVEDDLKQSQRQVDGQLQSLSCPDMSEVDVSTTQVPAETCTPKFIQTDTPTIQFRRGELDDLPEVNCTPPEPLSPTLEFIASDNGIQFPEELLDFNSELPESTPSTNTRPDIVWIIDSDTTSDLNHPPPEPTTSQADSVELPRSPSPPTEITTDHHVLSVHRSLVQQEMISIFMNPDILNSKIKYRFIDEMGADAQGVSREVYSAFWQDFFQASSLGEDERVPALFPDYGRDEWEAIGRILFKGYNDTGIYPLQLAYAFSCAVIYGEGEVSADMLVNSLRMYLSETDRRVVDKALHGQPLDSDDQDDFLDLLGRVNCHSLPSKDEIRPMVISIAHKELIQEPKYALDAIASVAGPGLQIRIPNPAALQEMYSSKMPTPRKVVKLLDSSPVNPEQASALAYLKQFIKSLDDRLLRKFLRHVTGSEFICTKSIDVTFNRMRGIDRAPQAHTCGPLLELPCTYGSYPEFRSEFMHILDANYMNMDIA